MPPPQHPRDTEAQGIIDFLRQVLEAEARPAPRSTDPFSVRALFRDLDRQAQRDATRILPPGVTGPGTPVNYHGSVTIAHGSALDLAPCRCRQCSTDHRTHRRLLLVLVHGYPRTLQHVHATSLTPIAAD